MAITETSAPSTLSAPSRAAIFNFAAAIKHLVIAQLRFRSTRKALNNLTARELADIGLTTGEIYDVARHAALLK